jgi:hypothetical protein
MSFSFSGSGKTKSEAQQSVIDGWKGAQPYAPVSALTGVLDAVARVGEPPAGKQIAFSAYGHSVDNSGAANGFVDELKTSAQFTDLPVEAPAPAAAPAAEPTTDPAVTAPAVDVPGTPASS